MSKQLMLRRILDHLSISQLVKVTRKPSFWFIPVLLMLITFPHYAEEFEHPLFITHVMINLGLARHAFERILYLAPIVWAGFLFSWRGATITSFVALACMLPRALFISSNPLDAVFETSAVFVIGNVLALSFDALRKERQHRTHLEVAHQELRKSEERYRELFENALDAIWIHDLDGNIIAVNRAVEKLSGYSVEELTKMNVRSFLSDESLKLAGQIRHKLLANEPVEQPYEQHLTRKDGSEASIQLATSLVLNKTEPVAFQHIARDVTEQKRMQENLHFYLNEVTKAQEEERKRISRELHDETIQKLVVLSRQLDTLASSRKGLSKENHLRLEEIWQQTSDIMREVRRLSQDLRPAALDRLGLMPALEWLASDVAEYSGITTRINKIGSERQLPEEVQLVLFRVTQEALRNVWRHSQATEAVVTVNFEQSRIMVTISDNGKGFELPQTIGGLAKEGKLGLAGMQERIKLIGGNLIVESKLNIGTRITVEIPIQSAPVGIPKLLATK